MKRGSLVFIFIQLVLTVKLISSNSVFRFSPLYTNLKPKEFPLSETKAASVISCARYCDYDVTCIGYIYNDVDGTCSVYNVRFYSCSFVRQEGSKAYEVMPEEQSDCYDVMNSGVYQIQPRDNGGPISVYCEEGGWLIFQRRTDGSEDFYRTWNEYRDGFGDLKNEFWLGNTNIHRLTSRGVYDVRIDLEDFDGVRVYAEYANLSVTSEEDFFQINIGTYSGDAGDSLSFNNGQNFTTKDMDRDIYADDNCALLFKGGWWYSDCLQANLNGMYLNGSHDEYAVGVNWQTFRGLQYSLKYTAMKIRPSSVINCNTRWTRFCTEPNKFENEHL